MGLLSSIASKTVIIKPEFDFRDSENRSFDIEKDTITTVITCEKVLSESLGKLPLQIYRNDKENGRVKDKEHILYNLLHSYPNSYSTSTTFFSTLEKHRNHYGNAYAKIIRNNATGKVKAFDIIHPTRITSYKVKDGELYFLLDGTEAISNRDILHFKFLSDNGIIGMNPLQVLSYELDNIFQGKNTLNNSYRNNLNIDKYIASDISNFNTANAKKSVEELKEEYSGSMNTKKTPVLPAGFKLMAAPTSSIQDAQILESLNFSKKDIAALYGVPAYMVGMEGSNLSIEQMGLNFKVNTLQYIVRMYRQELERKLLGEADIKDGVSIEFNTDALVEVDYTAKVTGTIQQVKAGLMTPNEANSILGNSTFDNGNYHYTQLQNSFPLEKLDDSMLEKLMAKNTGMSKEKEDEKEDK